jgi:hypothetical protein
MKIVLVILIMLLVGCTNRALIRLDNGSKVHGKITNGNSDTLYVKTQKQGEVEINKADIVKIQHPGSFRIGAGSALLVYHFIGFVHYLNYSKDSWLVSDMEPLFYSFMLLDAGILIWGAYDRHYSKQNMNKPKLKIGMNKEMVQILITQTF